MMKKSMASFLLFCSSLALASSAMALQIPTIQPTYVKCGDADGAEQVWVGDAQATMVNALKTTVAAIQHENDPATRKILADSFADIFKGTLGSPEWTTVKTMIQSVAPHIINESVYQCANKKKIAFCSLSGAPAFTPTSREKVILCKPSFDRIDLMSGILLHESMHRWGGSGMDYIGELYCADWERAQPTTARLARTPDAYMMFIYTVAQGGQRYAWRPCTEGAMRENTTR